MQKGTMNDADERRAFLQDEADDSLTQLQQAAHSLVKSLIESQRLALWDALQVYTERTEALQAYIERTTQTGRSAEAQPYIATLVKLYGNNWPAQALERLLWLTKVLAVTKEPSQAAKQEFMALKVWTLDMIEAGMAFTQGPLEH